MRASYDKYDIEHPWWDYCDGCGEPLLMTCARWEVLGLYHDGCFGYPACSCDRSHKGQCVVYPMWVGVYPFQANAETWAAWCAAGT